MSAWSDEERRRIRNEPEPVWSDYLVMRDRAVRELGTSQEWSDLLRDWNASHFGSDFAARNQWIDEQRKVAS